MEVRRRSTPTKKREAATSSSVASATDLRDPNDPSAWPDDISLDYFYRPHTITILLLAVSALVFSAFYRYNNREVKGCVLIQQNVLIM